MTTISVDINESQLPNFIGLESINIHSFTEEKQKELFKQFPFTLYKKRMMGDYMVTIQIPLNDYILYRVNNIVE